jgi:bifunctional non-homologous end joining protein LigD
MSSLLSYKNKRVFNATPEPKPERKKSSKKQSIFVIHKHAASHLHYDLRLELNGVLKSWAVPKGLPQNKNEKHLAIMVEDHPFEYRNFHGVIPKGNYGAGLVEIWDQGVYFAPDTNTKDETEAYMKKALAKGHVRFYLKGKKTDGEYSLIKIKLTGQKNAWLLTKIEASKPKTNIPKDIKPMLAKIVEKPFDDKNWLFEIKWDGYRALATVDHGKAKLVSRNNLSLNTSFPSIVDLLEKYIHNDVILDGELVNIKNNKVSFDLIKKGDKKDIFYQVFDLLYIDGEDLRNLPLIERKERLEILLAPLKKTNIKYCDHIVEAGTALFKEAENLGLEGIMAKKIYSPYVQARSSDWLKIKVRQEKKVIIGGFTASKKNRSFFGALLLGELSKEGLKFIGKVGTGFDEALREAIMKQLKPLVRKTNPFLKIPKRITAATFVKPELSCQVVFLEWTNQGMLRHPVFKKLLTKKDKK